MLANCKFTKCPYCNRIVVSKEEPKYTYKGRDVALLKHDTCTHNPNGFFIAELVNNVDFNFLTSNSDVTVDFLVEYLSDIYDEMLKCIGTWNFRSSITIQNIVYGNLVTKYNIKTYNEPWAEQVCIVVDYFCNYLREETFFAEKMKPIKLLYLKAK